MALAPVWISTLKAPSWTPKTRQGIWSSEMRVLYVHWMLLLGLMAALLTVTVHLAQEGERGSPASASQSTLPTVIGQLQVPVSPGGPCGPGGPGGPGKP